MKRLTPDKKLESHKNQDIWDIQKEPNNRLFTQYHTPMIL